MAKTGFYQTTCLGACPGPWREVRAAHHPRCNRLAISPPVLDEMPHKRLRVPFLQRCFRVPLAVPDCSFPKTVSKTTPLKTIATKKVNTDHAFLPLSPSQLAYRVREPCVDVGHDGKSLKNLFPRTN